MGLCVVLGNLGGTWAVRIWLLGLCVASDLVSSRGHGFGSQTLLDLTLHWEATQLNLYVWTCIVPLCSLMDSSIVALSIIFNTSPTLYCALINNCEK